MNVLKLLVNPIFLLAAGLHAGLLMIPVAGGSSEDVVPAPDPEGESITVTRIPPNQPATGVAAQTTKTNRPTQAVAAQASGKPASSSVNQQQKSKGSTRRQSNQGSETQAVNASSQTANNDRQSAPTAGADEPPGLPDLPADESDRVPVTVAAQEPSAPQPAPTLVALKDSAEAKVPDLLRAFLARLQYSLLKTRDAEAEAAKQAWLSQLREQSTIDVATPQALEKTLEISYPITVDDNGPREISSCLTPLPESGLLGVVVNESGATEPKLLRSTGYAFLNDVALKRIDTYDFPEANLPQAYVVPVAIDYDEDACVDLADLSPDETETTAANDR